ncbi:hypothetical protein L218DRAFT_959739 [Marasmius fiardii PR-910]|nr:hypothetical protein L218DRAFT_959739 [Marasmius fiardii PR-910]
MASRFTRQLFSSSLRSSRVSGSTWQSFKAGAGRRGMSSSAGGEGKKGSDLPWIIGSAVAFGPAFLYLASPSSRRSAPHVPHGDKHSQSHAPLPMKDDEGKEADVSGSIAQAEKDDVPQADAATTETHEEGSPKGESKPKDDASKGEPSMEEKKEAQFAEERKPEVGEKGSEYEKTPGASPDTAAKLQGGKTDDKNVQADKANKEQKEEQEKKDSA